MKKLSILFYFFYVFNFLSQQKSWDSKPKPVNVPIEWLVEINNKYFYNDELYSGLAFNLHYNQKLKKEFEINEGFLTSLISFNDEGDLIKKIEFDKAFRISRNFENNILINEYKTTENNTTGIFKSWYNSGHLKEKTPIVKGKYSLNKKGSSEMWYTNGNKMFECNYIGDGSGTTFGKRNTYYNNGVLSVSGEVNEFGVEENWNFYDNNGKLRIREIYVKNSNQKREFTFYDKNGNKLNKEELIIGEDFRTIDNPYSLNYPDIVVNKTNIDSLRYNNYRETIKLNSKVQFLKIEFLDQGCRYPYTSFSFRDKNNNELYDYKNFSIAQRHLTVSDEKLLSKTKYIYHRTCEGYLVQITVLYK
jgi:antitoxin component YwqK of YwqJK toxin-antitoxin module